MPQLAAISGVVTLMRELPSVVEALAVMSIQRMGAGE